MPSVTEILDTSLPHVTQILSILRDPEVEDWYASLGEKVARRKARLAERRGTKLDELIKLDVQGGKVMSPTKPYELKMGWQAWEHFKRERPDLFNGLQIGRPCFSQQLGYQGTPDLVHPIRHLVLDVKATTAIRQKHWIQTHAYVPLLWTDTQWSQATVAILRLDTFLGTYQYQEYAFQQKIFDTFLHLKEVYRAWYMPQLQGGVHGDANRQSTEAQSPA